MDTLTNAKVMEKKKKKVIEKDFRRMDKYTIINTVLNCIGILYVYTHLNIKSFLCVIFFMVIHAYIIYI